MSRAGVARGAIILLLGGGIVGRDLTAGVGVEALPRNNNKGGGQDAKLTHPALGHRHREKGGSHHHALSARGSVALHDSFPCEASSEEHPSPAGEVSASSRVGNDGAASSPTATAPLSDSLSTNSFMAQNDIEVTKPSPAPDATGSTSVNSSLNTRGGATVETSIDMDDDELDQMVNDLIAGLDGDEDEEPAAAEEQDDEESTAERSDDEGEVIEVDGEDIEEMNETESEQEVDDATETKMIPGDSEPASLHTNNQSPPTIPRGRPIPKSSSSSTITVPTTPTNAYYRFLVRRGPKGHFLAAFTLIAVQWIYVYTPIVYHSAASVLLKLRIYDPKILYERDRERRMRAKYGPPKKKGLTSKLFGSSKGKGEASQKKEMQKRADEEAANKLKQLYKTVKSGSGLGMLSEVKYRYLSAAFRRRHELGKEYRVEKPRTFMGEVVEGSGGGADTSIGSDEVCMDDIVLLDSGLEGDAGGLGQGEEDAAGKEPRIGTQGQAKRRAKRKKINDWVVGAFASHIKPTRSRAVSASTSSIASKGNSNEPPSSLWKTVERSAILDAAWESRTAELMATKTKRGSGNRGTKADKEAHKEGLDFDEAAPVTSSGGYGASKMFQSVMSRVGSNGRIFGAYPNDAPPIEECANEKGVIQLARRYGYGDWSASEDLERGRFPSHSYDEEDGLGSWGGEILGETDEFGIKLQPPRRKKQRKRNRSKDDIEAAVVKTRSRRKRRAKSSNN